MISEEIRAGRPGFAQVGTGDPEIFRNIARLFSHSRLYLEHSQDIDGLAWSVILKNVYAIAFGIADELRLGDNTRGFLAVSALREMEAIVQRLDGQPASCRGLAGLGDLITTATSSGSHHHQLGRRLVRGQTQDISGEGIHTLNTIARHAPFDAGAYPLLQLVARLIREPEPAGDRFLAYLDAAFDKGGAR
jgi:glycerol-3-phosphate dehydrogenase (NAD(P)+)